MMPFGRGARCNQKLYDRNIGLGRDQRRWHPGAMIEPAFRIGDDGKSVLREQVDDALCQRRIARCGIAHREEFVGEATEIMDRRRMGRRGNRRARSEERTSELQSLMRISYDVFCLTKKKKQTPKTNKQHK